MNDIKKYLEERNITNVEIFHNPSLEFLYKEELDSSLKGYEKGQLTELGAVNVMTGNYTDRSPKDKFIVMDDVSKDTIWWDSPAYPNDNHPVKKEVWDECKKIALNQYKGLFK